MVLVRVEGWVAGEPLGEDLRLFDLAVRGRRNGACEPRGQLLGVQRVGRPVVGQLPDELALLFVAGTLLLSVVGSPLSELSSEVMRLGMGTAGFEPATSTV